MNIFDDFTSEQLNNHSDKFESLKENIFDKFDLYSAAEDDRMDQFELLILQLKSVFRDGCYSKEEPKELVSKLLPEIGFMFATEDACSSFLTWLILYLRDDLKISYFSIPSDVVEDSNTQKHEEDLGVEEAVVAAVSSTVKEETDSKSALPKADSGMDLKEILLNDDESNLEWGNIVGDVQVDLVGEIVKPSNSNKNKTSDDDDDDVIDSCDHKVLAFTSTGTTAPLPKDEKDSNEEEKIDDAAIKEKDETDENTQSKSPSLAVTEETVKPEDLSLESLSLQSTDAEIPMSAEDIATLLVDEILAKALYDEIKVKEEEKKDPETPKCRVKANGFKFTPVSFDEPIKKKSNFVFTPIKFDVGSSRSGSGSGNGGDNNHTSIQNQQLEGEQDTVSTARSSNLPKSFPPIPQEELKPPKKINPKKDALPNDILDKLESTLDDIRMARREAQGNDREDEALRYYHHSQKKQSSPGHFNKGSNGFDRRYQVSSPPGHPMGMMMMMQNSPYHPMGMMMRPPPVMPMSMPTSPPMMHGGMGGRPGVYGFPPRTSPGQQRYNSPNFNNSRSPPNMPHNRLYGGTGAGRIPRGNGNYFSPARPFPPPPISPYMSNSPRSPTSPYGYGSSNGYGYGYGNGYSSNGNGNGNGHGNNVNNFMRSPTSPFGTVTRRSSSGHGHGNGNGNVIVGVNGGVNNGVINENAPKLGSSPFPSHERKNNNDTINQSINHDMSHTSIINHEIKDTTIEDMEDNINKVSNNMENDISKANNNNENNINKANKNNDIITFDDLSKQSISNPTSNIIKSHEIDCHSYIPPNSPSIPEKPEKSQLLRVICKFWPDCKRVDECPFEHPEEKVKEMPIVSTLPCKYWPQCLAIDCPYFHPCLEESNVVVVNGDSFGSGIKVLAGAEAQAENEGELKSEIEFDNEELKSEIENEGGLKSEIEFENEAGLKSETQVETHSETHSEIQAETHSEIQAEIQVEIQAEIQDEIPLPLDVVDHEDANYNVVNLSE